MLTHTRTTLAASLAALGLLAASPAPAANAPDVMTIINRANVAAYYQGKDGRAKVKMTIVDGKGNERTRKMVMLRRDVKDGGDQQFLVLFTRPADVRRTTFLVDKHVGRDDDRWMYLPGLDLVKRIAAADKRTSFVGSHFYYEDISGRRPDEDRHELVKVTDTHYVIRSTPKKPGSVEFKYYVTEIDKKSMLPTKAVYTDKSGKPYRQIEALEVETIDGKPTITKMKATDLGTGGHTVTQMSKIKYDLGVPSDVFVERSLRDPPKKWLK